MQRKSRQILTLTEALELLADVRRDVSRGFESSLGTSLWWIKDDTEIARGTITFPPDPDIWFEAEIVIHETDRYLETRFAGEDARQFRYVGPEGDVELL